MIKSLQFSQGGILEIALALNVKNNRVVLSTIIESLVCKLSVLQAEPTSHSIHANSKYCVSLLSNNPTHSISPVILTCVRVWSVCVCGVCVRVCACVYICVFYFLRFQTSFGQFHPNVISGLTCHAFRKLRNTNIPFR